MGGFFNTIILLGAIQGFIISILLWRRKFNRQAHRLLAALLFLIALASLNLYLIHTGWFETTMVLRIISWVVPMVIVMPVGPLVYFYIRSNLDPSFKLTRRHKWQFSTAIIDIIPELTAIIYIVGLSTGWLKYNPGPWGLFIDEYNVYSDIPRWLSLTIYTWLSFKTIRSAKQPNGNEVTTKWLRQFIIVFLVFQAIWLIYLVPYIIPAYSNKLLDAVDWYPIYIPLAIMIYWLGLKGYLVSSSFSNNVRKKNAASLPEQVIHQTQLVLEKAMQEDKLYLDPAFNLNRAAKHTGLPAKTISAVLNQHMNKSFNEWINQYRVQEFKKKITEGKVEQLTLSAIASECGFNSQATFHRIFKQEVGMTPSEYLKSGVSLPE